VPLYICFLDLKKAFDTVPRELLLRKLYNMGVRGKMFRVISDLYSRNKAKVLINGSYSREFEINSGVLQGSKLGPILFNIFINDLLNKLNSSEHGALIGTFRISVLGFTDDVVFISDKPKDMQSLLDMACSWARENQMSFISDKCKAMVLNRSPKGIFFKMESTIIDIVKTYKYLGVQLSSRRLTNLYTTHFKQVLQRAERRLH